MKDDRYFLNLAIEESQKSTGPHKFGAVIVKGQEVVAADHNRVRELLDPSAHAEISAIKQICKELGIYNLPPGYMLYASHEPCIMCFCCAAWAHVDRLVFATPASKQSNDMYEFKDVTIFEMAKKLQRPILVEHIKV